MSKAEDQSPKTISEHAWLYFSQSLSSVSRQLHGGLTFSYSREKMFDTIFLAA